MNCKTLKEFKKRLQEAIDDQDIKVFKKIARSCPFPSKVKCSDCPLSVDGAPRELIGTSYSCLAGSIVDIYCDYPMNDEASKKTTLAILILTGIKLLSYLGSKE